MDFDLNEHEAREFDSFPTGDGDEEDDSGNGVPTVDNAAGGDTPADDGSTDAADDMTDSDDDAGEDKSLAEKNAEQIDELTDAVKGLTDAVEADDGGASDGDKTAEVELPDGSVAEVSKEEAMSWFEDGGDGAEKDADEVAATKADVDAIHARLDAISREAAGGSQQLDQGGDSGEKESELDDIGKALS